MQRQGGGLASTATITTAEAASPITGPSNATVITTDSSAVRSSIDAIVGFAHVPVPIQVSISTVPVLLCGNKQKAQSQRRQRSHD